MLTVVEVHDLFHDARRVGVGSEPVELEQVQHEHVAALQPLQNNFVEPKLRVGDERQGFSSRDFLAALGTFFLFFSLSSVRYLACAK